MKTLKKYLFKILICTLLCTMILAIPAFAKRSKVPRNGKYIDPTGHIYIMKHGKPRTGYFTFPGKTYYGHKTSSSSYPKGSCTADALIIRHGKMYYFKSNGQKQTKSSRYITLNRHSTSVKYLTAGRMSRYNANRHCYQWLNPNSGRWEDTGMLCYPYGSIDWQK